MATPRRTPGRPGAGELRETLLAKRRYETVGPETRAVVQRAFELPADQVARLAKQISDWATARTSARGRTS